MRKWCMLGILFSFLSMRADITADFGSDKPLELDGKTLHTVENSLQFAPAEALTVKCRYKFDDINFRNKNWVCLVDKSDTSRNGFVLQYYFGQPAILINTDKGTFSVDRFSPGYRIVPADKEWHELAAVYDGKELTLYLDGMKIGSKAASGNIRVCRRPVALGGAVALKARYFTGKIASAVLSAKVDTALGGENAQLYFPKVIKGQVAVNDGFRFTETEKELIIGNRQADFIFNKSGRGIEFANIVPRNGKAVFASQANFMGSWMLNFSNAPLFAGNAVKDIRGSVKCTPERLTLSLEKIGKTGTLAETYSITPDGKFIHADAVYTHTGTTPAQLDTISFNLYNVALGGDIKANRFIYPPHAFNFLHGEMSEADAKTMNSRYVYGNLMSTDKLMLPYAMIYHKNQPLTLAMSITKRDAKNFVGVFGGAAGSLRTRSVLLKRLVPQSREILPSVIVSFEEGDWQKAMASQRDLMLKEYQWKKVRRTTAKLEDMVVLWDGIPGVDVETYEDLAKWMPEYRKLGINTVICGGRMWYCYFEKDPSSSVKGFIPIPVNEKIVPSIKSGGLAGLAKLRKACQDSGVRMLAWGPVSMSGMDKHADEGNTHPEWFNRKADGSWNKWYSFMIPGNPGSEGWRNFYVSNVVNILTNYGLQGLWFDSSWQDHKPNMMSPTAHYGESNGNVYPLMREISAKVAEVAPDAVLMGETCGIEAHMALDLVYTMMHGIWPAIPAEEVQNMVIAEALCRLPGFRNFGQVEMGLGFYPTLGKEKHEIAKKYRDSWIARIFLVSTSECTPVFFGLNWAIGRVLKQNSSSTDAEKIPELRMAIENQARNAAMVAMMRQVLKIRSENLELRSGETIFSAVNVSDQRIVNFVRRNADAVSVVLLNAEVEKIKFTLKAADLQQLKISASGKYQLQDLMSGKVVAEVSGSELMSKGINWELDSYQGAILKLLPR